MITSQLSKKDFIEFNTEMARLKAIKWQGYEKTLKEIGVTYIGNVSSSIKLAHSETYSKVNTYGIYLSPADESFINVCPSSKYCRDNCLNESGRNKIEKLAGKNTIERSRIIKTRLFFANRKVFMRLMIHEIKREMKRADIMRHYFAVRINCTSDLSPTLFMLNGRNILDIFPNVVFYDYTKVPNRFQLLDKYPNYDLTWSIDGSKENLEIGLDFIERGGRVAVVYGSNERPIRWFGYDTCDGDLTDYRPNDTKQVCMLKFKKTANNYINGQFVMPNTDFIVREGDKNCEW